MIILDLNQIFISNVMMNLRGRSYLTHEYSTEDLLRHMILNSIRSYKTKYKAKFGELIIANDDRTYWRRDYFPNYKWSRSQSKEDSELDWEAIYKAFDLLKKELVEYFPYRFIQVPRAEADDIIGVLCFNNINEDNLIVSSDGDFKQLHILGNVRQYHTLEKKIFKLTPEESKVYLYEHILRGDSGDGVPNFLSPDNTFVDKIRQKSISKKKLEVWLTQEPEQYMDSDMLVGYNRNKTLIDLTQIPLDVKTAIINKYDSEHGKTNAKLFDYFVDKKLKNLIEYIGDF